MEVMGILRLAVDEVAVADPAAGSAAPIRVMGMLRLAACGVAVAEVWALTGTALMATQAKTGRSQRAIRIMGRLRRGSVTLIMIEIRWK
jgi:hypothetical protein